MKQIFLFLVFLSIPFSTFAQEWQWLYPYPTTNAVIDFYFTDKDNGFIIAKNGEILHTTDGGIKWDSKTIADVSLLDIFCIDNNNGYILGREYGGWSSKYILLKSNDGGNNWNSHEISSYSRSYNCLYFTSENTGWVAGASGQIKMTNNGGVSWTEKSLTGDNLPNIFYIHFSDDENGVVIGKNYGIYISKTQNGGSSWETKFAGIENEMYDGYFVASDNYYTVGKRGLILNSNNYGGSWSFPSNSITKSLYSICFSDQTTGWAVGEDSTVLKTVNSGESWEAQSLGFSSRFIEVKFHDNNIGWILGEQNGSQSNQSFLFTEDAGQNWENKFVTFDEILNFTDVCFVDSMNGWTISNKKIYHTTDGGRAWELQFEAVGYYETLYSISFVDSLIGFCVGKKNNKGFILKTSDGGENWTPQSYAFGPLRNLYFLSELTGWFVGDDGNILRTQNGGSTLEYLTSGVTMDIVDLFFLDENHGWAVTNGKIVLRTNNGGINWSSSTFSTAYYAGGRSIFFTDSLTGYVGSSDGLFKSMDGGINWIPISLTSYENVVDIYFTNNTEGWALANYYGWGSGAGVVYHTSNGGLLWNEVLNSGRTANAFSFIPEGYAWLVGGNSTIAKYTHGSPLTSVNYSESNFGPMDYNLYQSYPNPFNASTKITYDLPKKGFVELKIFDVLGREVKTLVNKEQERGRHIVNLNLENYASGTYFYRIKADAYLNTKKLMLLK